MPAGTGLPEKKLDKGGKHWQKWDWRNRLWKPFTKIIKAPGEQREGDSPCGRPQQGRWMLMVLHCDLPEQRLLPGFVACAQTLEYGLNIKNNDLNYNGEKGPHYMSVLPAFVSGYITENDCRLISCWKSNLLFSDPDVVQTRTDTILQQNPCL